MNWTKIGTATHTKSQQVYGIWRRLDKDGRNLYRVQRAPIIPQGEAGYYNLAAHLTMQQLRQDPTP